MQGNGYFVVEDQSRLPIKVNLDDWQHMLSHG